MYANVRGDVVAFNRLGAAIAPLAYQVKVVRALAPDMSLADVFLGESYVRNHQVSKVV